MNMTTKILTAGAMALSLTLGTTLVVGNVLTDDVGAAATASPLSSTSIEQMNLTPAQQAEWETLTRIRAESQYEAAQRLREVRELLEVELTKPEPNLEIVNIEMEQAVDQIRNTSRENRTAYLDFYAGLTPAQKQVVAKDLSSKLERLDRVRGFLDRVTGNRLMGAD